MALPPENPTQPTEDRSTVAPISHFSIHHQHQKNLSAEIPENAITSQLHTRKLKDSVPAFCQIELFPLKVPLFRSTIYLLPTHRRFPSNSMARDHKTQASSKPPSLCRGTVPDRHLKPRKGISYYRH
ncbi:hypothetical protein AVEN_239741-1 [Araneus ventricosus]|uniref:Uncharacterized protein n=1 Tax=Araneus ventricosus TaxID=182803 RepID=A0A4Y2BND7_ARAVE|nr:hypothetical protein AVEN_239741-1 [Araneus ventricosus]